jgi:hypothetical protein
MNIRNRLLTIEKKWSWGFFGFILAIFFGAIALYTSFFQNHKPNLQFVIENRTPVLDLNKDIKELDILYKGINIKKRKENLSIITIKIINNGESTILEGSYDKKSPLKININAAKIVETPQLITTSNNYLKTRVNILVDSSGSVILPNVILEKQQYYSISVLLLHNSETLPTLSTSGKIAGQINTFDLLENESPYTNLNFIQQMQYGSIWVHLARIMCYIFFLMIVSGSIVFPISYYSDIYIKSKKKRRVKKYKLKKNLGSSIETDFIFDTYLEYNYNFLERLQVLIIDEDNLLKKVRRKEYLDKKNRYKMLEEDSITLIQSETERGTVYYGDYLIKVLTNSKMIELKKDSITINQDFKNQLDDFISYLKLI